MRAGQAGREIRGSRSSTMTRTKGETDEDRALDVALPGGEPLGDRWEEHDLPALFPRLTPLAAG